MAKGSVVKRSGSWYAVYRFGKRQKWEKVGTSKKSAEIILTKRLESLNSGSFTEDRKILFADFARKWLNDYAKVSVKQSTFDSYEVIFRVHLNPYYGKCWLHRITAGDIQGFISQKISKEGLSPKSVVNFLIPLKEMLKHAIFWGYLRFDPSISIKRPRIEYEEMDFLSPEEIRLFLHHVRPKFYALFLTAVLTGIRRGELLALQWGDVDWNSSQIVIRRSLYKGALVSPKSKHSCRRIVMTPMLNHVLEQHHLLSRNAESDLVFSSTNGQFIDADHLIRREFLPALDRAGLRRIRFHDLRHTYASLLIAQCENIKFIQSQLGHSSAKTTLDRYGHLMPNLENDAARRLDKTVFGNFVRKLLENPASEGFSQKMETPEVIELQGLKIGSGGRI